jgi:hypothetical protein
VPAITRISSGHESNGVLAGRSLFSLIEGARDGLAHTDRHSTPNVIKHTGNPGSSKSWGWPEFDDS